MDPYFVEKADFKVDRDTVQFTAGGRNGTAHGLSKGEVKRVRSKITDTSMVIDVEVVFPKLFIQSKYKGNGRFNDLVFNARGNITIYLRKYYCVLKIPGIIGRFS